ncbi:MAG: nucleotide sugar dehydrogenase [Planctomycetota bacterium]
MSTMSATASALREKIAQRTCTVGVVGLGYVGLPIVGAYHDAGYRVIGYDNDQRKTDMLTRGETYLEHLGDDLSQKLAKSDQFTPTTDPAMLAEADAILLCVPTPLGKHREPDLSFVIASTEMVAKTLREGQLIVLESTTYPGTTRGDMMPILEATGLRAGEDFFLAYSPEREDPGRIGHTTSTIPKLVGGIEPQSTELATMLYEQVIEQIHTVSSAEVAESAKLLENIYRAVNIALVNELKVVLDDMDIDVWEVISAASTKPFGFQAFYPGPGLGGHCIPIDPFYLTWKAKEHGHATRFIELAGEVNAMMPHYVVDRTIQALNDQRKSLRGSKILIVGVAYKPNINDVRESPAAEIIDLLVAGGADLGYHDPHVPEFPRMRKHDIRMASLELTPELIAAQDAILVITDHDDVSWQTIADNASLVVDTRNVMAGIEGRATVIKA